LTDSQNLLTRRWVRYNLLKFQGQITKLRAFYAAVTFLGDAVFHDSAASRLTCIHCGAHGLRSECPLLSGESI